MPRLKGKTKKRLPAVWVEEDLYNKMYMIYGDPMTNRFQYGMLNSITEKLWKAHIAKMIEEGKNDDNNR